VKEPKTKASRRTITLPAFTVAALAARPSIPVVCQHST
jgi:hypothetical protein